jgi:drug/metabolite transporter (DMT)-like permease
MIEPEPLVAPRLQKSLAWFLDPYTQLAIGAVLVTASELLLKKGASTARPGSLFAVAALGSGWTWLGIALYVVSFFNWLYVLRLMPLGIAFGFINSVQVLVPIGAWVFLHEAISTKRWMGIGLILLGVILLARPAARAEEKL